MNGAGTIVAIRLFVALTAAAALVGLLVRRLAIPYSVALVLLGAAVAVIVPTADVVVTPELILSVLVPGLVFEAAYRIDFNLLRHTFGGVALLAAPGVLISAVIVAIVLHLATGLPLDLGFVVGAMVAATDPVAVIATFRQLGAPPRLAMLVEGESLFNDGTGLVVFSIAVRAVQTTIGPLEAVGTFVATVLVSTLIGIAVGWLASRLIATVDDHLVELSISLAAAYGTYLVADAVHESGIIATVVAGLVIGTYGRRVGMSRRTQEVLDVVWEFIAFLLTALVFLLIGLSISISHLLEAAPEIGWSIVAVTAGRAAVIYGLFWAVARLRRRRRREHGIPVGWLHVLFWAGLRGAVAVAMALSLPLDFPQRPLLQEITFGVVLFTLLLQGTTAELVIRRASPGRRNGTEEAV